MTEKVTYVPPRLPVGSFFLDSSPLTSTSCLRMPSSSSGYIPLSYAEAPRRYASSARSQLSSNPRASWSIGGLLFLTLLLFATSSPFSPSEPSYSSPLPTSKAHRLLYYAHESESEEGTCSFLDPTLGFSEEELSLMERIPSAKADPVGMYEGEGAEGGVHPLFGLIKMGETKFRGLVEKRSESLEEAVVEYRKRYGRSPPKRFDKWWEYVSYTDSAARRIRRRGGKIAAQSANATRTSRP
jgi:hypothetical protein